MKRSAIDSFSLAEYYDCTDPETLSHESPEEAIEQMLDDNYERGISLIDCIASLAPITVTAYNRMEVGDTTRDHLAERLAEHLDELLSEDYGNPDGDMVINIETPAQLRPFRRAVDAALKKAHIWSCAPVAKREYSAAEVEALMREHQPDWFKED